MDERELVLFTQITIKYFSDIVVTVLEVKGDQIRLGITAPRDVQVYREELLHNLDHGKKQA